MAKTHCIVQFVTEIYQDGTADLVLYADDKERWRCACDSEPRADLIQAAMEGELTELYGGVSLGC